MLRIRSAFSGAVFGAALTLLPALAAGAPPAGGPAAPGGFHRPRKAPLNPLRNIQTTVTDDWLAFGHDPQRTGWDNGDATFTPKNVSHLKLLWSTLLPTPPSPFASQTLTAPVVVSGVRTAHGVKTLAFTISSNNILFAIDADTGKIVWQRSFSNPLTPARPSNWLCTNAEQATPVIDKKKGVLYFTTSDGDLRAASLADGRPMLTPTRIDPPFSRNWSLDLVGNWVYTSGGRGCGGEPGDPTVSGNVDAANVSDPAHVTVQTVYTSHGKFAGPWDRGGPVLGPEGVYVSTADGRYDPASGFFAESVVAVQLGGKGIADSFTPSDWRLLTARDYDLGAGSPVIFPFHGRALLAIGAKQGIEYLLDADQLGGFDHATPLYATPKLGNDAHRLDAYGIWGGAATWANSKGDRFIYVPMWNAPSKDVPSFPHVNGDVAQGSIMAFQVLENHGKFSLQPAWISGVAQAPDSPSVAGGVVFEIGSGEQTIQRPPAAIRNLLRTSGFKNGMAAFDKYRNTPVGHQILYAFDAQTGKQLYSSRNILKSWDHFNQPVISDGKVFVVSYDAHIYAFGLKKEREKE